MLSNSSKALYFILIQHFKQIIPVEANPERIAKLTAHILHIIDKDKDDNNITNILKKLDDEMNFKLFMIISNFNESIVKIFFKM